MKQRKMTKRQILNELLAIQEKQLKLKESQQRLYARMQKEKDKREKLAANLAEAIRAEAKKNGNVNEHGYALVDVEDPIVFKNHIFELEESVGYTNRTEVDIRETKSVK